jgi:preprotein translocase subunit YajC
VNPVILIFVVMIGAMILMTRSAKNKQRQATQMRSQMEPGTGVRTIGGMYAVVKEVNEETVLLELTDGVHAHFAKNAIGAVLSEEEFNRIVHGIDPEEPEDLEESARSSEPAEPSADAAGDDLDATPAEDAKGPEDGKDSEDAPIDLGKPGTSSEQDGSGSK